MAAKQAAALYRVVAAWLTIDLPDGSRRELKTGDITSAIPEKSLEWLLAQGYIVPAGPNGKSTD